MRVIMMLISISLSQSLKFHASQSYRLARWSQLLIVLCGYQICTNSSRTLNEF